MADGGSYVSPRPTLTLKGSANPDMRTALLDLAVRMPEAGMASAELRMVNWGDKTNGTPGFLFDDVALGDPITIAFGLAQQKSVFEGEITAIEERYGDGAPQLVLLAEDRLHRLARRRTNRVFEEQSPNAIVATLANDAGLGADAKLSDSPGTYHQLNESDLHFLRRLAARYGSMPRLQDGKLVCRAREALPAPVTLDAGDTLHRLRVTADLARQPVIARARGRDLVAGIALDAQADSLLVPATATTASAALGKLGWDGEAIFAVPAPATQDEADAIAAASFDAQGRRFLHGDAVCGGNPDITPGAAVTLTGVSPRLSGAYAVVSCAHLFDEATGYQTYARLERGDRG